jgi:uncharacterized protein YndB with AHSA1/START domain
MTMKKETKIVAKPGSQEIFIEREFEAPRDLVFRAFSEPDLLVQWLGPDSHKMEIEKFDNRSGGSYRFVHIDGQGIRYGFNGAIHEVAAPERVIRTFEFEGLPERGHVSMDISLFEILPNDRTRLKIQSIFKSVADRDGMIASGMESGMNESYAKLDQLLKKIR